MDSISCFIKIEGLPKILGIRASLASSTQYLRDNDIVGDYFNLFDGQFIVKLPLNKK